MFCVHCGNEIKTGGAFCSQCGAACAPAGAPVSDIPHGIADRKIMAGLLGIFLGGLGIHKFYLGFTTAGLIEILLSVISCGTLSLIGFIEGIIYLAKSDRAFYQDYIVDRKSWF